jgi:hypothetical protein
VNKINPSKVRYIKLGAGGEWEKWCIENSAIRLGYGSPYHEESLIGQWDKVRGYWIDARNGNEGAATRDTNQIRDFYELSEDDLWITFYQRKLWWCRASKEVEEIDDGNRIRKVIGKWSYTNVLGQPLTIENIDGRVTKVQGFRGTICGIELEDYLINKINGVTQPEVQKAKDNLVELKSSIKDLIMGLWWNDFELLVDLIFYSSGWQRVSVLGKTEKDIDLDILSPVTQKRAFVQIKSRSGVETFEHYISLFEQYEQYNEMYYVVHTSGHELKRLKTKDNIHLMDLDRISELVVNAGLVNWLITKRTYS